MLPCPQTGDFTGEGRVSPRPPVPEKAKNSHN